MILTEHLAYNLILKIDLRQAQNRYTFYVDAYPLIETDMIKPLEPLTPHVSVPLWLISHIRNNAHHSDLSRLIGLEGTITG